MTFPQKFAEGVSRGVMKITHALGFSKGYNVVLFIIFAGAFMGFALARLQYLDVPGTFCAASGAAPGECFYYLRGRWRVGILLHLGAVLPSAILACFQFIPLIRHRYLIFHRVNGYLIILLTLVSNAGAIIICRHSFGGDLVIQSGVGLLVIATTTSISMAYYNIKRLQVDQHRAWMLRTFFYMGSIITVRILMIISAQIITKIGTYYQIWPCEKLDWTLGGRNKTLLRYPSCGQFYDGGHPNLVAPVLADFNNGGPEQSGAALGLSFGAGIWLAFFLHAIGVEIYIHLTPGESARLRQISYERQLEGGFDHPGNAGLTVERLGDCDGTVRFAREKPQQVHETAERSRDTTMVAEN